MSANLADQSLAYDARLARIRELTLEIKAAMKYRDSLAGNGNDEYQVAWDHVNNLIDQAWEVIRDNAQASVGHQSSYALSIIFTEMHFDS